jgi:hypothetical protein
LTEGCHESLTLWVYGMRLVLGNEEFFELDVDGAYQRKLTRRVLGHTFWKYGLMNSFSKADLQESPMVSRSKLSIVAVTSDTLL